MQKLELALSLTQELHHKAFENFANSFIAVDYPELKALGGKHDGGIDGLIVSDADGRVKLVVQSCVSPTKQARSKILNTVHKLEKSKRLPQTLVYCTSAVIGESLDDLKRDLRSDKNIHLEIHDAKYFVTRGLSKGRGPLCEKYASEIIAPITATIDHDSLYSESLSDEKQRLAFQFLEAQKIARTAGGNVTKQIFDSLILWIVYRSQTAHEPLTCDQLIKEVSDFFPQKHQTRITEIVSGRVNALEHKAQLRSIPKDKTVKLTSDTAKSMENNLETTKERDTQFRATLLRYIAVSIESLGIDYRVDENTLVDVAHRCIFWHMHSNANKFRDPYSAVIDILSADRLLVEYLRQTPTTRLTAKNRQIALDILPRVIHLVLSDKDEMVRRYLRDKADLFIMQGLMQVTPDVQDVCKSLVGNDLIFLDTSALVRCIAELYGPEKSGPLTTSILHAREMNTRFRVFRPHLEELVAHLNGPVLREWENNCERLDGPALDAALWSAPLLVNVFHRASLRDGLTVRQLVEQITGARNQHENVREFLEEELSVSIEEMQPLETTPFNDNLLSIWRSKKRRNPQLTDDKFEQLVIHDVSAFSAITALRESRKIIGPYFGEKIWLLTFDSMFWKVPHLLGERDNHKRQVGMSMDFLLNYVAMAAQSGLVSFPNEILCASAILDESELGVKALRETVTDSWEIPGEKEYQRRRRLRDALHEHKSRFPESQLDDIELA
jgi:hypothetical protein